MSFRADIPIIERWIGGTSCLTVKTVMVRPVAKRADVLRDAFARALPYEIYTFIVILYNDRCQSLIGSDMDLAKGHHCRILLTPCENPDLL